MATLSITKDWADGEVLLEADLDNIKDDVESFINTTKLNDDNLQDSGITASSKLVDASISTAKLANSAVTTPKIADLNVTTAKIADSNVTTAKIADSNVTKAKLATAARDPTPAAKSSDDTLDLTEDLIYVDSSSGTVTLTLPAASSSSGHEYLIKKVHASNTVVVDGNSSETIDGAATFTLYQNNESVKIFCDGSGWRVESHYVPGNTFQPVIVRAKRTSSQSIASSTETTIVFDTELVDNKSAYDNTTGIFTCPSGCGGQYLVAANMAMDDASGGAWGFNELANIGYKINSDSLVILGTQAAEAQGALNKHCGGTDLVTLAAGDTLKIMAYQTSGASADVQNDSTRNHFAIVRVA